MYGVLKGLSCWLLTGLWCDSPRRSLVQHFQNLFDKELLCNGKFENPPTTKTTNVGYDTTDTFLKTQLTAEERKIYRDPNDDVNKHDLALVLPQLGGELLPQVTRECVLYWPHRYRVQGLNYSQMGSWN